MARGRVAWAPVIAGRFGALKPSRRPGVVAPLRVAVRGGGLSGERERERDESSPASFVGLKRTVFVERFRLWPGLNLPARLLGDIWWLG